MLGSILSTVFVGYLVESTDGYADLVAETYVERNVDDDGKESFFDSLGMVRTNRMNYYLCFGVCLDGFNSHFLQFSLID